MADDNSSRQLLPCAPEEAADACTACGKRKPLTAYSVYANQGGKPYRFRECKTCRNAKAMAIRKADPDGWLRRQRAYLMARAYGITLEDFEKMLQAQGGVCAICGKPETATTKYGRVKSLHVDHCHKTGKVRGLLCNNCNHMLGNASDDPQTLWKGIEYLAR